MRTRQAVPGMKMAQTVVDQSGRLLVERGAVLDEYIISSLLKLGIMGIYVGEDVEEEKKEEPPVEVSPKAQEKIEQLSVEDSPKVRISESVKKRVDEGIQFLFNNTESDDFTNASASVTSDLMKAIAENDAVAVDIDMLKVSDEYTFKHSVDVATMGMIIAKKLGLDEQQIYEIGIAGLLHDVGKSKIPSEVLNKPGKLTDEEFGLMKKHAVFGYEILKDKKELTDRIRLGVLQHHEKINGKGYPMGVPADKLSLYARILAVADIYDALVTERPYKKAFSKNVAIEMIMSMTGELDINVMRGFLHSVILYPVGSLVTLSNGEVCKVVANNPANILRPTVVGVASGNVYNLLDDLRYASLIIQ
ncbi:MAG: HD-GYP domain-containing protein [Lachnospiraceae bacterium]